ncbi:MAG TPA: flagellar filament capping protein FliD [Oxalicibacterium sp.]|nr:flagellar filament capping protein FliD [Oxalicibacterium sp.]
MGISSPGIGSNLPIDDIVSKLMTAESQPLTLLAQKEASYQAKLSGYGNLSSALSQFQSTMANLGKASTFQSLSSNIGDDDIFTASLASKALTGSYQINVTQLAQAQTITTSGQASKSATIGSGASTTISFQFGKISGGTLTNGIYTGASFTQDAEQETGSVTIDSSNNSLQGISDAINAADIGVTASIISDGSDMPARLVLTSKETGEKSSMKITVDGDPALQSLLGYDPAGTQNLTQSSAGQNTLLNVNGTAITAATTTVEEAIQGVTLNIKKIGSTSMTVTQDTSAVQNSVNAFAKAYNDLNATLQKLTAYTPATKAGDPGTGAALFGESSVRTIQDQIRNTLTSSLAGLSNSNMNLPQIGVGFDKDGNMTVDSDKLGKALKNNFNDIAGLFATVGKPTDSLINFTSSGTATKAGSYDINITKLATQATMAGDVDLTGGPITIAADTTLDVKIDGISANVSLTAGSYTASQLASMVQSAINGTSKISSAGVAVTAKIDSNGGLQLVSDRYGSASNISVQSSSGTSASTLFGSVTSGTDGVDVEGTIGGVAATGSGQILTAPTGSDAQGLKIEVLGGALGARGRIDFSQGYADRLNKLVDSFIGDKGLLSANTTSINSSIKNIDDQRDALNVRLAQIEKNYRAQFTALDVAISSMSSTQQFLTQQLAQISANSTSS